MTLEATIAALLLTLSAPACGGDGRAFVGNPKGGKILAVEDRW